MLLLDAQRLVDQVNRAYKFDIRYRIVRTGPPMLPGGGPDFWTVGDGLAPKLMEDFPLPLHIESVGLEAFLHERVMIYAGEDVTVRDLIDHVANVVGGVHAGKAREVRDLKLNELAEETALGGMDAPIFVLRAIVLVVAEALRPLRDAIEAGHRAV